MYVLGDQPEWTPERIAEAMHAENEQIVKLTAPIPVYIGYWTARASGDGRVEFRKDVYDFDAPSMAALLEREDRARQSVAGMLAMKAAN
jgi:murein L,D-transpeptidase YcbB/YkuD